MTIITCIEDLQTLYQRRVPRMFYDYTESGSWSEATFRDNTDAFEKIKFRQRVLVNMENRNLSTSMLGQSVSMPVALAPVGLTGMQRADGEIKAARAAEEFGVPYTLSTMSICSIEDVARSTQQPFWFQLYVMRDRDYIKRLINRAKAADCSALVLTVDLQIIGQRHKDIKNGLSTPPKPTLVNLINMACKPGWAMEMLKTPRRDFGNISGHVEGVDSKSSLSQWTAAQFDPSLSWNDVKWIKDLWQGKLIIKGIIDPEDAQMAVDAGADAVIVSNHGGRQLDGAPASIDALPQIVSQIGDQACEIWMDGGIRSGQHIFKALALGATATLIGRSYIYGLGAMGQPGVTKALHILRNELDLTMAFCGLRDIHEVSDKVIWRSN
ncbi:MAG: alpha-hydroxy-acid oxidizing protein [Gammaproteobacteria bacterium]|nr:alpha-hydroxy-acid oxidizing protein [Gammaproteobacteria bacterium]MBT5204198.1 alpha-hydroxy-acid oxidizing protein [Gammaproteobacteria bacterium]MBT5601468.1 alpha-hydroxy-acid oxidizing protein [Gammaproteobacteria bacterium]